MRTYNAIRGHVRPLVHPPITIKLASVIPYIYDAAELWESLYMHACVGGMWMEVVRPCPPVLNVIMTPRHLFNFSITSLNIDFLNLIRIQIIIVGFASFVEDIFQPSRDRIGAGGQKGRRRSSSSPTSTASHRRSECVFHCLATLRLAVSVGLSEDRPVCHAFFKILSCFGEGRGGKE